MGLAEKVTFGGSDLDRAAHLRGQAGPMADLLRKGRVLPLWRGKPFLQQPAGQMAGSLSWWPADHDLWAGATAAPIFLGLDAQGGGLFARDLSSWTPEAGQDIGTDSFLDATAQHHPACGPDHAFLELRAQMTVLTAREAELAATARGLVLWHARHGFCAACGAASQPAKSGWQRDCPACGASHFPRTDPVVIMLITRGNRVLVGRNATWPEGMYSLLAGFMEPGETLEAAVRREVFEEAGIRVGDVGYLASQPWPFPASLMLGCWGLALDEQITLDPDELQDARWVSREEMLAAAAGRHPVLKPPRKGAIAQFLIDNWLADRLPKDR